MNKVVEEQIEAIIKIKENVKQNGFLGKSDAEILLDTLASYILEHEKLWIQLNHAWVNGGEYIEVKNDVQ